MARRSNSTFEDIADIASKFPWWAGVSLALISFLLFHWYAGKEAPVVTASGIDGIYNSVSPGLLRILAFFGQIILPCAFLSGSVASVFLNGKRADNAAITDEKITYRSDKGLVVVLNRNEVKTVKKVKIDQ